MSAERVASKEYITTDSLPELPEFEQLGLIPDSPEALAYVASLKPAQYAAFGLVLEPILRDMQQARAHRQPDGYVQNPYMHADPWLQLKSDSERTAHESLPLAKASDHYGPLKNITRLMSQLDTGNQIDPELQLLSGFGTAAVSMLNTLRNIPDILKAHGVSASYAETARQSVGIPWKLAMICVNQHMAAQHVMTGFNESADWADIQTHFNPDLFIVRLHTDGTASIGFSELEEQILPEGFSIYLHHVPKLKTATRLGDIACHRDVTIGCPITLLGHSLHDLWNWYIDVVEHRQLWEL